MLCGAAAMRERFLPPRGDIIKNIGFASVVVFMCRAEFLKLCRRLAGPNPVHKRFRSFSNEKRTRRAVYRLIDSRFGAALPTTSVRRQGYSGDGVENKSRTSAGGVGRGVESDGVAKVRRAYDSRRRRRVVTWRVRSRRARLRPGDAPRRTVRATRCDAAAAADARGGKLEAPPRGSVPAAIVSTARAIHVRSTTATCRDRPDRERNKKEAISRRVAVYVFPPFSVRCAVDRCPRNAKRHPTRRRWSHRRAGLVRPTREKNEFGYFRPVYLFRFFPPPISHAHPRPPNSPTRFRRVSVSPRPWIVCSLGTQNMKVRAARPTCRRRLFFAHLAERARRPENSKP